MIKSTPKSTAAKSPMDSAKPGSDSKHIELPGDFGILPNDSAEVEYASHSTREQDPGRHQGRSNEDPGGRRDVGVGVDAGGAGAGSGGDIDMDIVGVGTHGSGLSQSPNLPSDTAASEPTQRTSSKTLRPGSSIGSTPTPNDNGAVDLNNAGADAIRNDAGDDPYRDATAGEISSDESNGSENDEGIVDDPT